MACHYLCAPGLFNKAHQQFLQVKAEQLAEIPKLRILDWSASALFKNNVWTAGNDIVQLSLGKSQLRSPTVVNSFVIEDPVTERKWFIASFPWNWKEMVHCFSNSFSNASAQQRQLLRNWFKTYYVMLRRASAKMFSQVLLRTLFLVINWSLVTLFQNHCLPLCAMMFQRTSVGIWKIDWQQQWLNLIYTNPSLQRVWYFWLFWIFLLDHVMIKWRMLHSCA